jgi:membrane fusion protein (multidrug efflux system)
MQHKDSSNHPRLKCLEAPLDFRYRRLRLDKACARTVYPLLLALLLGLLITSAFPGSALGGPPGPGGGSLPLVTVAKVTEQDVNPPAEYVGHVQAVQTVDLRARIEGFLEQVKFREGSDVRAGDLLYVIEQTPYQAKVDADTARVTQATATLTKALQYLERVRTVRSGGVSATDIDDAVAEELRAKAQLEEDKANLERSRLDLGYTMVRAPISGRIGRTAYTKGNLMNPASGPLARIVQIDPIRVVYSISENDLVAIKIALKDAARGKKHPMLAPRIKLPGGKVLKTSGQIDFVDNTVDPGTGTIAVWALFDNPDGMLLPGQYVTVLVARSQPELMTVVPQAAVLEDHDGRYVLLVDDQNRVVMRRVETGPVVDVNWVIKSGLAVNERVIVQGIQKVRPGQTVKTITKEQRQGR